MTSAKEPERSALLSRPYFILLTNLQNFAAIAKCFDNLVGPIHNRKDRQKKYDKKISVD